MPRVRSAPGPRLIERQQPPQDRLVGEIRGPIVGPEDGGVEPSVRLGQPFRRVVELGQSAGFEVGIARYKWIEPGSTLLNQAAGGGALLGAGSGLPRWMNSGSVRVGIGVRVPC